MGMRGRGCRDALCSGGLARSGNSVGAGKTQGKKFLGPVTAASWPILPRGHTRMIQGFFTLQKPWKLSSRQGEDGGLSPLDPALIFNSDQHPTTLALLPMVSDPANPPYPIVTGKHISLCGILKKDANELIEKDRNRLTDFEYKLQLPKGKRGR